MNWSGASGPPHLQFVSILNALHKLEKLQLTGQLNKRIQGLFIHCNLGNQKEALHLRACIASIFQDHIMAIKRLDFHGVVGVCDEDRLAVRGLHLLCTGRSNGCCDRSG